MKNFVQQGDTLTVQAPTGGIISGAPTLIGTAIFGVAAYTAPAGAGVSLVTEGVFDLLKAPTATFAAGDKAFWDAVNNVITATATGNAWVGVVIQGVTASSTTVRVRLNQYPIV